MNATIPLAATPRFYKQWLLARNPVRYFKDVRAHFGDFVLVRGLLDMYFVNHPDLIGYVLLNKAGTINRTNKIYERLANVGRSGLASSDGAHWKKQRRILAPLFTASTIRNFGESMTDTALRWARRWETLSRDGTVFDIKDEMNELTLEVNARCLFDTDVRRDQDQLQGWFGALKSYIEAFPYPVVRDWWFPSPMNARTRATLSAFDRYTTALIEKRRRTELDPKGKDLISRMLTAKDTETGQTMTNEEIRHEMQTFFVAGYETSSAAMTWIFYHLSQNPAVEAMLHRELDSVLGNRPPSVDDIPNLRYLRRVIDEVMRVSPSAWFMGRGTTEDVNLGGNPIKKGSLLMMAIPSLHNHPGLWPNPEVFDPNRFLPEAVTNRPVNAYVPFCRGEHTCIGKHFALQELVLVTAVLASRFRVTMEPQKFDPEEVGAGISMSPKNGIRMRAVRRREDVRACA